MPMERAAWAEQWGVALGAVLKGSVRADGCGDSGAVEYAVRQILCSHKACARYCAMYCELTAVAAVCTTYRRTLQHVGSHTCHMLSAERVLYAVSLPICSPHKHCDWPSLLPFVRGPRQTSVKQEVYASVSYTEIGKSLHD